ncbi:MAG: serine/threonine protein kinase [Myxococcales bacterium]|nr:serine/threonine protein kinase [Myxococcales bacterium]MBK7192702.1 serine/threonine protein kinase [Myxococcales bacterium]MBP6845376.1 serine/threonine protein kinase [Kofleriaceae bacterium]
MQLDADLVGKVIGGKYRIERVVGQGGCGVVVRAVHRGLGHPFAIKLLKPMLATRDDIARRFVREAQALAKLTSEHTVRAFDVGVEPGLGPFFVMEWLEGMTVAQALATGPIAVHTAVDYALQICAALAEAHRVGLIHRDIKPSNLFIARRIDGRPLLKVMDFGVAKWTGAGGAMTAPSVILGSPGYLAPEQARDARSVDARADIWSVGAVLYEMVSGQRLYSIAPAEDLGAQRLIGAAVPLPSWIPARLRATIERCLARDPAARYPHVTELAAELAAFGSPSASDIAVEINRIARAPSAPHRGRVDLAPTLDLVRARPSAPPPVARWRRRVAPLAALAAAAVAVVAVIVAVAVDRDDHRRGLATEVSPPLPAPLPPLVTPLPPPAATPPLVAPIDVVAPPPPPPPAPPRSRTRPPRRDESAPPSPRPAAPPPGVPGDVDGDGIPDVR